MSDAQDVALDGGGQDVTVIDGGLTAIEGPAVVAQDMAEALRTPRGSLPWAIKAGSDLVRMLNSAVAHDAVAEAEIRRVALADPRVDASTVTVGRADTRGGRYRLAFRVLSSAEEVEIDV